MPGRPPIASSGARRPAPGFTLVEVLVALAVLSLLLVALYAGLRGAARSWERAEAQAARSEALRVTEAFLRRYLERALPLLRRREGRWQVLFEGEPDGLRFATVMPAHLGGGGIYEVSLTVEDGEEGPALELARRLLHPDLDELDVEELPRGLADRSVLVEGVEALELAYLGAERPGMSPRWSERWTAPRRLPDLVRVRLVRAGGEPWPEILIRPHVDLARPLARPRRRITIQGGLAHGAPTPPGDYPPSPAAPPAGSQPR